MKTFNRKSGLIFQKRKMMTRCQLKVNRVQWDTSGRKRRSRKWLTNE